MAACASWWWRPCPLDPSDAATFDAAAARIGDLFAGDVTPDVAVIARPSGTLVSYQVGSKETMTVADGAATRAAPTRYWQTGKRPAPRPGSGWPAGTPGRRPRPQARRALGADRP